MIERVERELILSIETAVEGGSLSILDKTDLPNQTEIDGWSGTLEVSKAEDVLERIAKLLKRNDLTGNQIKQIGISKDVGSLTGRKIGLALAKGLSKSLRCELIEISTLEALLLEIKEDLNGEYITALASGRNNIWWQIFRRNESINFEKNSSPRLSSHDEFCEILELTDFDKLIFSSDIMKKDWRIKHNLLNERRGKYAISSLSLANLIGFKINQTNQTCVR